MPKLTHDDRIITHKRVGRDPKTGNIKYIDWSADAFATIEDAIVFSQEEFAFAKRIDPHLEEIK